MRRLFTPFRLVALLSVHQGFVDQLPTAVANSEAKS